MVGLPSGGGGGGGRNSVMCLQLQHKTSSHQCPAACVCSSCAQRNSDWCDSAVWRLCTPSVPPLPLPGGPLSFCGSTRGLREGPCLRQSAAPVGNRSREGSASPLVSQPCFSLKRWDERANSMKGRRPLTSLRVVLFFIFSKPRWSPTAASPTFILKESEFRTVIRPSACD